MKEFLISCVLIEVPVVFCGYDAYKDKTAAGCQQGIADGKYTKEQIQTGTYASFCKWNAHPSCMFLESDMSLMVVPHMYVVVH